MKKLKIISLLLALTMFVVLMSATVTAADTLKYTKKSKYNVSAEQTLNPENFNITASIDKTKIGVLEGGNINFSYNIISFTATYVDVELNKHSADYITEPDAFFAIFEKKEEDVVYAKKYNEENPDKPAIAIKYIELESVIEVIFEDSRIYGSLDYTISLDGFSAPISAGGSLGFVDDLASAAKLPIDVQIKDNIAEFPSIADFEIKSTPKKTIYTDADRFDPSGLSISVTTTAGVTGTYTYNDETAYMFTFNPSNKENLNIFSSEVITYLNGIEILKTPIVVEHDWSDGYVNITTDKVSENKPGYHAIVCEGCGETHDAQEHVYDDANWVYNNDQTFLKNGTMSNVCEECGATLITDAYGTAEYLVAFADFHFIGVIFDYIHLLLNLIYGAV